MRRAIALLASAMLVGAVAAPAAIAASQSPCQGMIAAVTVISLPAGYWTDGEHTYAVRFVYDDPVEGYDETEPDVTFTVGPDGPLADGPAFMRYWGLSWTPGPPVPVEDNFINSDQATVFWGGYVFFPGDYPSYTWAKDFWAHSAILYSWDGGPWVEGTKLPLANACGNSGFYSIPNEMLHAMGQLHRHYSE